MLAQYMLSSCVRLSVRYKSSVKLDDVVETWNDHYIRQSRKPRVPSGRPNIMYSCSHLYGAEDESVVVDTTDVDVCKQHCTFRVSQPCENKRSIWAVLGSIDSTEFVVTKWCSLRQKFVQKIVNRDQCTAVANQLLAVLWDRCCIKGWWTFGRCCRLAWICINPFQATSETSTALYNLSTGKAASQAVRDCLLEVPKKGKELHEAFIKGEWVSSFLTAHKHNLGHLVPLQVKTQERKSNIITKWKQLPRIH